MKLSIFTTCTNPIQRCDPFYEALACYRDFADEVILVDGTEDPDVVGKDPFVLRHVDKIVHNPWPDEFKFDFIGTQFQKGYDASNSDFVLRTDLDMIFHENDKERLREIIEINKDAPVLKFPKKQFILPDRYNYKSKMNLLFNKGKYGNRIKLNAGGDLCQMSFDGNPLPPHVPYAIQLYNYDYLLKPKQIALKDLGRFSRAWFAQFQNHDFGGETDEEALMRFMELQLGRLKKSSIAIALEDHPKYIRETIRNIGKNSLKKSSEQPFGYSMWGNTTPCSYFA